MCKVYSLFIEGASMKKNLIEYFYHFYSCYVCNKSNPSKTFAGFWDLQKHLSSHNSVSHQFASDNSFMNFHTESPKKDIDKVDERSKNTEIICSICGKRCKSEHLLAQHAMAHVDRKLTEVQCKICFKWMKNRNILRAHEIIHNESPLKCPHCDKIKFNERALKSHILQCHSTLKHQCTTCGKSFARPNKLKVCLFFDPLLCEKITRLRLVIYILSGTYSCNSHWEITLPMPILPYSVIQK